MKLVDELSPESIYLIARDLLSALGCLERLGLVHGDLSPILKLRHIGCLAGNGTPDELW